MNISMRKNDHGKRNGLLPTEVFFCKGREAHVLSAGFIREREEQALSCGLQKNALPGRKAFRPASTAKSV